MKLSVMVDIFFGKWGYQMTTEEYLRAMEIVKEAGYDGIEILMWWNDDLDAIRAKKDELGIEVAAMMTKVDCLGASKEKENFLADLKESIKAAKKLGCKNLFCSAGHSRMFISEQTFFRQMINTLKEAGDILEGTGIRLLIEPVNVKVDHAGVFPLDSHDTFFMMQVINSPNIKVLYDIYHQQITEGNLLETIGNNIEHIGHFHAAGSWGRNEIANSEVNYPFVTAKINEMGYDGFIGMEYEPKLDKLDSLLQSKGLIVQ